MLWECRQKQALKFKDVGHFKMTASDMFVLALNQALNNAVQHVLLMQSGHGRHL